MLTVLMQSVANGAGGIYMPKFVGTIYELLSAPVSYLEIIIGFVGAAATKSLMIGLIIFATANFFVELDVRHPLAMIAFLMLTCVSFSLFGFIVGIWAKNFEQLQVVPMLIVSPLVFLGGAFYSISMLPPAWQTVTLFNPVVYLISGFRWSFFGTADVGVGASVCPSPRSPCSRLSASPSSPGSSAPAIGCGPESRFLQFRFTTAEMRAYMADLAYSIPPRSSASSGAAAIQKASSS
jgi:hypothetical protein